MFSLRRPPPRSTLFPYTTLFRSDRIKRPRHLEADAVADALELQGVLARPAARSPVAADDGPVAARLLVQDRKSTRLNFSHANISYAVFCSKKKQASPRTSRGSAS